MADGRVLAGAAKVLPCDGDKAAVVYAELEGLLAMKGNPNLVQCLAAFVHTCPQGCHYLTIVME